MAIAMEKPHAPTQGAAVYFARDKADVGDGQSEKLEVVNTNLRITHADGRQIRHDARRGRSGRLCQACKRILLGGRGRGKDGKEGVWFFESDETRITPNTNWHLVDVWGKPACTDWQRNHDKKYHPDPDKGIFCWAGAAASIKLTHRLRRAGVFV